MSQYTQGGHVSGGDQFPVQPGERMARPPAPAQQGTPLGRIVAGVFLGLLAWTVTMVVLFLILAAVAANQVDDLFSTDDLGADPSVSSTDPFATESESTDPSGISDECKADLDSGGLAAESIACLNDDTAAVLEYAKDH
jgi:hypothetical protein